MGNDTSLNNQTKPFGKQMLADAVCRPLLFASLMVNATFAGIKEMTRRTKGLEEINVNPDDWQFEWADFALKYPFRFTQKSSVNDKSLADNSFYQAEAKCPYGKVGDILWVRETFVENKGQLPTDLGFVYKAELGVNELEYSKELKVKWKPSLFMPKSACRLFLEITNVRVERLKSIKEIDCLKEGAVPLGASIIGCKDGAFGFFKDLWISINGQNNWELNPWVWVISFKVVECPYGFR